MNQSSPGADMSSATSSRRTPLLVAYTLWSVMFLFAISAIGCGDDTPDSTTSPPNEQLPPEETTPPDSTDDDPPNDISTPVPDYSDVVPIPCTDQELCYDPTDPDILARETQYRAWLEEIEGLNIPGEYTAEEAAILRQEIDEMIRQTHIVIGLCNYFKDEDDHIRVHCPDELEGLYFCPHMWFRPEMPVIGGIRYAPDELPTCFPTLVPEDDVICSPQGCAQGAVCSGRFSLSGEPIVDDTTLALHPVPVCLSISDCLRLRAGQSLDPEQSCFYGDLSTVDSGALNTIDCENLDPYTCASNCPCADQGARCAFVSEETAVGLCVTTGCQNDSHCDDPVFDTCVGPKRNLFPPLYDWFEESNIKDLYELPAPPFALCANGNTCDQVFSSDSSPVQCD